MVGVCNNVYGGGCVMMVYEGGGRMVFGRSVCSRGAWRVSINGLQGESLPKQITEVAVGG